MSSHKVHVVSPFTHTHTHTHTHTLRAGGDVGYLSCAAGDGDPVLTGDVTGAVVGGAGTRARRAVACGLCNARPCHRKDEMLPFRDPPAAACSYFKVRIRFFKIKILTENCTMVAFHFISTKSRKICLRAKFSRCGHEDI